MKKIIILVLILFMTVPFIIFSQTQPACVVIYAEGDGFTVVSGSDEHFYDLFEEDVIGLEFKKNDMIFTESDTLLEVQVASSNNIIKISENSSFKIEDFEEKGGGSFALTYGKIRAKVQKLTNTQKFTIDGKSAVCGVRGTDFGYDVVADPLGVEDDLVTKIYCFEGSVEVEKKAEVLVEAEGDAQAVVTEILPEEPGMVKKILITADEMVSLSTREPEKELVKETVSDEITAYWDLHEFKTDPLTIITLKDLQEAYQDRRFGTRKSLFWGGMGLVMGGTVLELASFFLGIYAGSGYEDLRFSFRVTGGILIGAGAAGLGAYAAY